MEWHAFPLLFAAGCVAGAVNVLAGGGSFLTLPVLIFLGLPPGVANGTNRVAIVLQNVAAVWGFRRHRIDEPQAWGRAALPATFGAVAGAWLALRTGDEVFQRLLALFMVAMSLASVWTPRPRRTGGSLAGFWPAAGFVAAGVYGGFVQAGVGFLFLAVTSRAGLDLVRGNAVKVISVLALTLLSLVVFAASGRVAWVPGLALAAGTVAGGLAGVRLTVLKGHRWVRRVVTASALLLAVKLWLSA